MGLGYHVQENHGGMMPDKVNVEESTTLQWPEGWDRTRVTAYQKKSAWKYSRTKYQEALVRELELMGAASIKVTRSENERDPGIAVWFSMTRDKQEWQDQLGIDNPLPTLDEIDTAYKTLAKKHHPDHGGDTAIYLKLVEARKAAKEWVLGTHTKRHEFVMALDLYNEQRLNMAGLRLAIANLRSLKRLGMPSILERTLNKAFKVALLTDSGDAA